MNSTHENDFERTVKTCMENEASTIQNGDCDIQSQDNTCDYCNDPLLFAMQDNFHKFSIGLFTILQCLKLAEDEGHVPHLPEDWWIQLANRYNLKV